MLSLLLSLFVAGAGRPALTLPFEDPKLSARPRNVAIVLFPGVELLDFAGPTEVFCGAHVDHHAAFRVYTVANTHDPVKSLGVVEVKPEFALDDCPAPDIVVVPGGEVPAEDPVLRKWVQAQATKSEIVMSVCNGALVLGGAGLLDGLEVTSHKSTLQWLALQVPTAKVFTNRRFVDNGKIVTTAGISAGIDGALHVVERLCGADAAWQTARGIEYDWRPDEIAKLHARPGVPVDIVDGLHLVADVRKLGLEAALVSYSKLDPKPEEAQMNTWGYALLRSKKVDEAVAMFRLVEAAFPASANASDSLSEALEAKGDVEASLRAAKASLARLGNQSALAADRRALLENAASSRVARLSGAGATSLRFACPPCGGDCDKVLYIAEGACPGCKMQLVEKSP